MKRFSLILAFAACHWQFNFSCINMTIISKDALIGDGGNIIVFALPGVNPTPVANILLDPTEGVFKKYTKNITLKFEELNEVLKKPRMDKQICSAIRNRETNRSVIDAFQFNELTTLKPNDVYDIFNKTIDAVGYRVDVAIFVVKHHEAKAAEQLTSFINTVLGLLLQGKVQVGNAIVVCHHCMKPDFYQFGKPYNHQPLKNINSFVKELLLSDGDLKVNYSKYKEKFLSSIVDDLIEKQFKYLIVDKPVIILLGQMGVGKSTIGNCLINLNASEELIRDRPFATNNNVVSCTNQSSIFSGHEFVVIDTVGFGDPVYPANTTLSLFKNALELVNYRVDLLLFVTKSGRLTKETLVEFFETISQNLLTENVMPNAIFICNKCKKGWIDEQKRAPEYQKDKAANFYALVDKFGNRTFEFNLEFSSSDDLDGISKDEVILRNQLADKSRKKSIDKLAFFLKQEIRKKKHQDCGEVNMDFVKSKHFENVFLKDLENLKGNRKRKWDEENANVVQLGGVGLVCFGGAGTGVALALGGTLAAIGVGTCATFGFAYLAVSSVIKAVQKYHASDRFSATECITCCGNFAEEPKSWISWIFG